MARPKKQDSGDARQRLLNAFWELLENRQLNELTVGAITSKAHCNRGTFYYHFTNLDDLVLTAIENEYLQTGGIADEIFNLMTETGRSSVEHITSGQQTKRLLLLMKHGGASILETKAKSIVLDLWRTALCPDGSELTKDARFVIEYATSGMLGLMSYLRREEESGKASQFPRQFAGKSAAFTLSQISEAQGLPKEEVLMRLKVLKQFIRTKKNS